MQTKVQKWGNSLGIRIPRPLADQACIGEGSVVDIEEQNGEIVIKPVAPAAYTLDELVAGITEENRHGEIGAGGSVGREVW